MCSPVAAAVSGPIWTVRSVAHISLPTKTVRSSERIFNSLRVPIPTAAEFELWINCGADSSFRGMCRPRPPSATHSSRWFFLRHQSREGKWTAKTDRETAIRLLRKEILSTLLQHCASSHLLYFVMIFFVSCMGLLGQ